MVMTSKISNVREILIFLFLEDIVSVILRDIDILIHLDNKKFN